MMLLSEVLDWMGCRASAPATMDPFFVLGCHMAGNQFPAANAVEQQDIARQSAAILGAKGFVAPVQADLRRWDASGAEIYNDIYVPGHYVDTDGLLHIHYPVMVGVPLSSTFIGRDWRFAAPAYWLPNGTDVRGVVITAWDATGRRISDRVEPGWLGIFGTAKAPVGPGDPQARYETPGSVCVRCSRNGVCKGLESFLESHSLGSIDADPRERIDRQQKLFIERMALATKLEVLTARQEQTDRELRKICVDGQMNIGSEVIKLEGRRGVKRDYSRIKAILVNAGLWLDRYGAILGSALQEDLSGFPPAIRDAIAKASTETVTEPSITEAIKAGRNAGIKPNFRGMS